MQVRVFGAAAADWRFFAEAAWAARDRVSRPTRSARRIRTTAGCGRWKRTSRRRSGSRTRLLRRSRRPLPHAVRHLRTRATTPTPDSFARRSFATAGTGRSRTRSSKPASASIAGAPDALCRSQRRRAARMRARSGARAALDVGVRGQAYYRSVDRRRQHACAAGRATSARGSRADGLPRHRRALDARRRPASRRVDRRPAVRRRRRPRRLLDAIVHRIGMGPVTAVARVERLDYDADEHSDATCAAYTAGARVRADGRVSGAGQCHRQPVALDGQRRTALDVGARRYVRRSDAMVAGAASRQRSFPGIAASKRACCWASRSSPACRCAVAAHAAEPGRRALLARTRPPTICRRARGVRAHHGRRRGPSSPRADPPRHRAAGLPRAHAPTSLAPTRATMAAMAEDYCQKLRRTSASSPTTRPLARPAGWPEHSSGAGVAAAIDRRAAAGQSAHDIVTIGDELFLVVAEPGDVRATRSSARSRPATGSTTRRGRAGARRRGATSTSSVPATVCAAAACPATQRAALAALLASGPAAARRRDRRRRLARHRPATATSAARYPLRPDTPGATARRGSCCSRTGRRPSRRSIEINAGSCLDRRHRRSSSPSAAS